MCINKYYVIKYPAPCVVNTKILFKKNPKVSIHLRLGMILVCYSNDGLRSVGSHGARSGALGTRNQYAVGAKTELSDRSSKLHFKCDKGIF